VAFVANRLLRSGQITRSYQWPLCRPEPSLIPDYRAPAVGHKRVFIDQKRRAIERLLSGFVKQMPALARVTGVGGEAARQTSLRENLESIFQVAGFKKLNAKPRPVSDGSQSQVSGTQFEERCNFISLRTIVKDHSPSRYSTGVFNRGGGALQRREHRGSKASFTILILYIAIDANPRPETL
jgi:hypothetical protein